MTTHIIDRLSRYCTRAQTSDPGNEHMTLPDFCDICLDIHGRARQQFVDYINANCDRAEARGEMIEYPLRKTRRAWYADWNAYEAHDQQQTEMGARYAGVPR